VIVTGGAGFIGSHLTERLVKEGCQVTVLDNLAGGNPKNLASLRDNDNLTLVEMDITNYPDLSPIFRNVDWVFHLAGLADIVPSIDNPTKYHKANVDGTIAILEASRQANIKRFVYAASSSCYGIPDTFPTNELDQIKPMYPYALTKYIGEECVLHWNKVYKIPTISLRLFNVYGPRVRTAGTYGAVLGVFLAQKLAGEPFTVVGDGTQTRDFTFVTDVVDCFVKAAESDLAGEIFNVGSGGTYSINYLAELLDGPVVYLPKRPGEPDCTFADISKVKSKLGWDPKVTLEDGVRLLLDDLGQWQDAPLWDVESITDVTKDWFKYLG